MSIGPPWVLTLPANWQLPQPRSPHTSFFQPLFSYRRGLPFLRKKNISSNEEPGKRYDVYKIDYGCYVDLLTTSKAPQGLLPFDEDGMDGIDQKLNTLKFHQMIEVDPVV